MPRKPGVWVHQGWWVTSAGGTPKQKLCLSTESKKKAELLLARLIVKNADTPHTAVPNLSMAALIDRFLDHVQNTMAENTYKYHLCHLKPLREHLGTKPADSISDEDANRLRRVLDKGGRTKGTIARCLEAGKTLFRWASGRENKLVRRNPWGDVKTKKRGRRLRFMTEAELNILMDNVYRSSASDNYWTLREFLATTFWTGMRPGEVRTLIWDEIDWANHTIFIPATKVKTKTVRTITMLPVVEEILRGRRERQLGLGFRSTYVFAVCGGHNGKKTAGAGDKPLSANGLNHKFRTLRDKCVRKGLIEEVVHGEQLHLYGARHAAITRLVEAELPLKVIMDEAGHVRAETTNRYTHLTDKFRTDLVRRKLGGHRPEVQKEPLPLQATPPMPSDNGG